MILAGNQPYFLPYIGYWQLMNAADLFIIADDYQYIRRGWINRNRILCNGKEKWLSVSLQKTSVTANINEIEITNDQFTKQLNCIKEYYSKAPFFSDGYSLMEEIFSCEEKNLAKFLISSIKVIQNYLDIHTPLVCSSEIEGNNRFRGQNRIFDFCRRFDADICLNAKGGQTLYSFKDFREQGVQLKFLSCNSIVYKQFENPFVPNLSILDVIMFNSREKVIKLLDEYSFIEE